MRGEERGRREGARSRQARAEKGVGAADGNEQKGRGRAADLVAADAADDRGSSSLGVTQKAQIDSI